MREILFRGKSVDSDKWVEGSFVPDLREVFYSNYLCDGFIKPFGKTKEERLMVEVERKTVGQYTGLTDKNGKKIFEGDIIQVTDDEGNMDGSDTGIGRVEFYEGLWYVNGGIRGTNNGLYDLNYNDYALEVIGNILDNPELLTED